MHNAKSAQMMRRLTKEHPWLYQMYMDDGRHAVQRTDLPINEIWTDLIIEQVLVRSLKPRGGPITQGRGMTESVRYQWVFIMHQQAAIHDAMAALTSKCHLGATYRSWHYAQQTGRTGYFSNTALDQYSPFICALWHLSALNKKTTVVSMATYIGLSDNTCIFSMV